MKHLFTVLLVALPFLVTCSKDKGTTPQTKSSIGVSTSEIRFSLAEFDPQPAPRMVVVSNTGQAALNCGLSKRCDWLELSQSATQLNAAEAETVFVTVHPSGKSIGIYVDSIVLTDTKATNSPQIVAVTLEITRALKPAIAASSEKLSFYSVEKGPSPSSQILRIYNSGSDTLKCTASKKADWLSFDMPPTNLCPGDSQSVLVSVNSSGKGVGIYRDTILLQDSAAANSPFQVPVFLTVAAESTLIIIDSTDVRWSYIGLEEPNLYWYSTTSTWRMKCYSNVGKSANVYSYAVSDSSNTYYLGDVNFPPLSLSSGESFTDSIQFRVGFYYSPPPLQFAWLIWVKYRVDGVERFTKALFVPGPSSSKRLAVPGQTQRPMMFSRTTQLEIIR
jgi:hypothetical protein